MSPFVAVCEKRPSQGGDTGSNPVGTTRGHKCRVDRFQHAGAYSRSGTNARHSDTVKLRFATTHACLAHLAALRSHRQACPLFDRISISSPGITSANALTSTPTAPAGRPSARRCSCETATGASSATPTSASAEPPRSITSSSPRPAAVVTSPTCEQCACGAAPGARADRERWPSNATPRGGGRSDRPDGPLPRASTCRHRGNQRRRDLPGSAAGRVHNGNGRSRRRCAHGN